MKTLIPEVSGVGNLSLRALLQSRRHIFTFLILFAGVTSTAQAGAQYIDVFPGPVGPFSSGPSAFPLIIGSSGEIFELRIQFSIQLAPCVIADPGFDPGGRIDELDVSLFGPQGAEVELMSNEGGLSESLAVTIDERCQGCTSDMPGGINCTHLAGSFLSNGDLRMFDGHSMLGVWTLWVDGVAEGTLIYWALEIIYGDPPSEFSVEVTKTGPGNGTVTSSPAGLDCGATCMADFASGSAVWLQATPAFGSEFWNWGNDPDCTDGTLTMDSPKSCTADFQACSLPSIVILPAMEINGLVSFGACNKLTAGGGVGGFRISSTGEAEFFAGNVIELENGFSVSENGLFLAVIGPAGL